VIADLEPCGASSRKADVLGTILPTIITDAPVLTTHKPTPTKTIAAAAKSQAKGRGGKSGKPPIKLIAGGIGGFALLAALGVWLIVRDKDGNEVARVAVPEGGSATVVTSAPPPAAIPTSTAPPISFFPTNTPAAPSFLAATIPVAAVRWPLAPSKPEDI